MKRNKKLEVIHPDDLPQLSVIEQALAWKPESGVEIEGESWEEFNARRAVLAAAYLLRFDTDGGASMPSAEINEAVACVLDRAAFLLRSASFDRLLERRQRGASK